MPRCFNSAGSLTSEQAHAVLLEQFRTLRRMIPLMYAMMLADSLFLSFAAYGTVEDRWSIGMPAVLVVLSAIRVIFWLRRRETSPDPKNIRRYLRGTTAVAAVLSLGFGAWGLFLYVEGDLVRRACIALYVFVGAISCCYCLQSLPRAGWLVLSCGAAPVVVCLLTSGDWFLGGLGVNMIAMTFVILRMLRASYASFVEVVVSRSDMAAEQRRAQGAEQRAHQLAYHDPLSGLPNRRALLETLEERVTRQTAFGLLVIDLDRFKSVNDVHGHPAGDQLLRDVATRLNALVQGQGHGFRLGGDEFALVVDGDGSKARRLARAVVQAMAAPFATEARVHHIGASVGISLFPQDASDRETLMRRADIALYKAKQAGRSQHCAFEPVLDAEIRHRAEIESEMRDALAQSVFVPYYQPIVDLATQATIGFELLARWPRHGEEIGPDQFIPIAEECGLIGELTLAMLRRACEETREWGVTIAINVSPSQLKDPWFSHKVLRVLSKAAFPPQRLLIEITENALIVDGECVAQTIASLKNQGICLALDDFGTGYSSLQHLRMLPFDKLKIDRSFVTSMETDPEARRMVQAILGLAKTLGLPVVAEGIEDAATAKTLAQLGCAQGQGYYFGYPMARADVEATTAPAPAQLA
jgi:diguanylate cyclase (GGDEF)-like protein